MKIIAIIKDVLSILAIACPAAWAIWLWHKRRSGDVSWRTLEKSVERLHKKMTAAQYRPNYIVCLGRAGAVIGSMLSHQFKKPVIPIMVFTFTYRLEDHGKGHQRVEKLVDCCVIKDGADGVLLLGPDVMTGATMVAGEAELEKHGINKYKTACLYLNPVARRKPDFYVSESDKRLQYPWMPDSFSDIYEQSIASTNDDARSKRQHVEV